MPLLRDWQNFYVIVGSASGALIGLQFVVVALLANFPDLRRPESAAFSAPPVVYFCVALLLSALGCVPWSDGGAALPVLWGITGIAGLFYAGVGAWRFRTQKLYEPVFVDWVFYAILPTAANAVLVASALSPRSSWSAYGVAAATLLLLFLGIHVAWDAVTYHVFGTGKKS